MLFVHVGWHVEDHRVRSSHLCRYTSPHQSRSGRNTDAGRAHGYLERGHRQMGGGVEAVCGQGLSDPHPSRPPPSAPAEAAHMHADQWRGFLFDLMAGLFVRPPFHRSNGRRAASLAALCPWTLKPATHLTPPGQQALGGCGSPASCGSPD